MRIRVEPQVGNLKSGNLKSGDSCGTSSREPQVGNLKSGNLKSEPQVGLVGVHGKECGMFDRSSMGDHIRAEPDGCATTVAGRISCLAASLVLVANTVMAQGPPGIPVEAMIGPVEQSAANVRNSRQAFEAHADTPGAVDVIARIVAPGGFVDRHGDAMGAWLSALREEETVKLDTIAYLHNSEAAYQLAVSEAFFHLQQMRYQSFEVGSSSGGNWVVLGPGAARARIVELTDACYIAPPGMTLEDCRAPHQIRVHASWPEQWLEGVYDEEVELELELPIENAGDETARELQVSVEFGLAYVEVSSEEGTPWQKGTANLGQCKRGTPWVCSLGDLPPGQTRTLYARLDLRPGDDAEIPEDDRLVVTAFSFVNELEEDYNLGGYSWRVRDCDLGYRRRLQRLPLGDLLAAANEARETGPDNFLPGYAVFYDAEAEVSLLGAKDSQRVTECIEGNGPDRLLQEGAGKDYQESLQRIVEGLSDAKCGDDPASKLAEAEGMLDTLRRELDHVSRLVVRAQDASLDRERNFRASLATVRPEDQSADELAADMTGRTIKPIANRMAIEVLGKESGAYLIPRAVGILGLLKSVGEALESTVDRHVLRFAETEMKEAFSAMEAFAYLEGLSRRYADLIDALEAFRDAIQKAYDDECYCIDQEQAELAIAK